MDEIKQLWWNVFISWLKIHDIYEPFKSRLYNESNIMWLKKHNIEVHRFSEIVGDLDYDYVLWAFLWAGNVKFKNEFAHWRYVHLSWSVFKQSNKFYIEGYKKHDRDTIKKLIENGKNR